MFFKKKQHNLKIDKSNIPNHIAIIMDGNGRWAAKRGMPRKAGHVAGASTFRKIADYCETIGVKYLTVYAFSTENWKRPEDEINSILNLLKEYLLEGYDRLSRDRIKVNILGDTSILSEELKKLIADITSMNKDNYNLVCNVAFNYGGKNEIVTAVNSFIKDNPGKALTEKDIAERLYTAGQPEPDLIIRTGGEIRISNFLLWQCAYSELWFTDVLWPDFTPELLDKAIIDYQHRIRKFGGVV